MRNSFDTLWVVLFTILSGQNASAQCENSLSLLKGKEYCEQRDQVITRCENFQTISPKKFPALKSVSQYASLVAKRNSLLKQLNQTKETKVNRRELFPSAHSLYEPNHSSRLPEESYLIFQKQVHYWGIKGHHEDIFLSYPYKKISRDLVKGIDLIIIDSPYLNADQSITPCELSFDLSERTLEQVHKLQDPTLSLLWQILQMKTPFLGSRPSLSTLRGLYQVLGNSTITKKLGVHFNDLTNFYILRCMLERSKGLLLDQQINYHLLNQCQKELPAREKRSLEDFSDWARGVSKKSLHEITYFDMTPYEPFRFSSLRHMALIVEEVESAHSRFLISQFTETKKILVIEDVLRTNSQRKILGFELSKK